MIHTTGVDAIATITELRSNTTELLDHVRESKTVLLIQKNNVPYAVMLDWEMYLELATARQEGGEADRTAKRHGRHTVPDGKIVA
jgi:prevent-host-death family protein